MIALVQSIDIQLHLYFNDLLSNLKQSSLHCRTIKTIGLAIFNSVSALSDKMAKSRSAIASEKGLRENMQAHV